MSSKVREKIVAAAMDRFHALGYTATGVKEIVDTAGVPKGSFYNYFKAKELLAREVFELYMQSARLEALDDRSVPPKTRLRQHFDSMAANFARMGYEKGCLVGNLVAEVSPATPLLREAIATTLTGWTARIAATIREGQQNGSFDAAQDPDRLARFLLDGWQGAIVRMKYTGDGSPLDDFLAIAFPLLTGAKPTA